MSSQADMEVFLRGRQFKKALEQATAPIRAASGLKQIEVDILSYMAYRPSITSSELCRALALNKGHVSQAMASLCKKGLLRMKPDIEDRRRIAFRAAKQALPLIASIQEARENLLKQVFRGVTEEELAVIQSIKEKVFSNLDLLVSE